MRKILVTGALGQIGSELVPALRARYGNDNVVASDVRMPPIETLAGGGPFEFIDCTNPRQVQDVVRVHNVGAIYHLAALLSATAEEKPHIAWQLNMDGLYHVLETARSASCRRPQPRPQIPCPGGCLSGRTRCDRRPFPFPCRPPETVAAPLLGLIRAAPAALRHLRADTVLQ